MVGKENLTFLKIAISLKPEWRQPIKIGVHAQYIDLYLHDFFEPILQD